MASQAISSRNMKLVAILLLQFGAWDLVSCLSEASSLEALEPSGSLEVFYESSQQEGNGNVAASIEEQRRRVDPSSKRYLLKEFDSDGFAINSPTDRKHYINLRELLDTIDASPIIRSGRTLPSTYSQTAAAAPLLQQPSVVPEGAGSGSRSPQGVTRLLGFSWTPLKSNHANNIPKTQYPRHALMQANEQLLLNGPHRMLDYEGNGKRQENTRWNNLRGMWGKRSGAAGRGSQLAELGASALEEAKLMAALDRSLESVPAAGSKQKKA